MKANINKYSHGYDIELFHCKSRLSKISIQSRDSPSLKVVKNAKRNIKFLICIKVCPCEVCTRVSVYPEN